MTIPKVRTGVTFFLDLPATANVVKGVCTLQLRPRQLRLEEHPANLPDKTYGAPVDYAYFDIFNTGSRSNVDKMISPTITADLGQGRMCFSFWFAAFGAAGSEADEEREPSVSCNGQT